MLQAAVRTAAGRAEVREAVARVYAGLQQAIDDRRPGCSASGRCCKFDEYGHRLYVTTIELAVFVGSLTVSPGEKIDPGGCPFQAGGLCSVHAIRPFGCRVFYCEAATEVWQQEQYERFHGELKRLHEAMNVPYFYVEWRGALRELGLMPPAAADGASASRPGGLSLPQLRL